MGEKYLNIIHHYESCLEKNGDTHLGVDWPRAQDVNVRHQVMLDLLPKDEDKRVKLLDFGCGAAHFYEFIQSRHAQSIEYSGLDLSPKFVELSKQKFPHLQFYCLDVLKQADQLPRFDYAVMNGVFTQKRDLSFDEMFSYLQKVVSAVFTKVDKGLAFNVMSKQVDWEKEGSFHLSFELLAEFLTRNLTRKFTFRHDYGLYEYTAYVYR